MMDQRKTSPISSAEIIAHTALAFNVPRAGVIGPSHAADLCRARYAACLLLRERGLSLSAIGARLGRRHYSTILAGIKRANDFLARDTDFAQRLGDARAHRFAVLCFKSRREEGYGDPSNQSLGVQT